MNIFLNLQKKLTPSIFYATEFYFIIASLIFAKWLNFNKGFLTYFEKIF